MKKTILLKSMLLLCALIVGSSNLWAVTKGTLVLNSDVTSPVTNNNVTFTWTSANIAINKGTSSGFKASSNMTITIPSGKKLTKIEKTNGNTWGSGATINVYTGSNNSGTKIASIVAGTNSYDIASNNTGTTYYFENSTGKNAWITDLSITYDDNTMYTVTIIDPTGGTLVVRNGSDVLSNGDKVSENSVLSITATPDVDYNYRNWQYKLGAGSWNTKTSNFNTPAVTADIQIRANFDPKVYHTITYNVNGSETPVNVEEGQDISFDAPASGIPTGYRFTGWVEEVNKIDTPTDTDPKANYVTSGTSTTDVTYYAVMAKVVSYTPASCSETTLSGVAESDEVVIVGNNGDTYAMSNGNGAGSAPAAVAVTISGTNLTGTIADNIKWNVSSTKDGYVFYPNGSTTTWLYCLDQNNGIRVGTNDNKTFTLDDISGYLKHVSTSRYLGIYSSQDWRCYTGYGGNIADQTFKFYKCVPESYEYEGWCTSTPPISVTVTVARYATFVSDFDLDYSSVTGLKAYRATVSGTTITFEKVTTVPAGEGVLLEGDENDYEVPVKSAAAWAADDNAFVRGTGAAVATGTGPYNYILNKVNGEVGFYKANGQTVATNRAYLQSSTLSARIALPFEDDETTGVSTITGEKEATNSNFYNLAGQRVAQPTKGLYIVNGKKVIIK